MKAQIRSIALPLLAGAYPILFLFGHNALNLPLGSLIFPLGATLLAAAAAYGIFFAFQRRPIHASLSATAFVILFFAYGFLAQALVGGDRFRVDHFPLLPAALVIAGYAGYAIARLKPAIAAGLQRILLLVTAVLVVANLALAAPAEYNKARQAAQAIVPVTGTEAEAASATQTLPDIYYIIFDEYVGFDAMRDYWHDPLAEQFNTFLQQNHFYVARNSRSPTINTLTEMASRLNLENVPENAAPSTLLPELQKNKVMQVLKAHGYTTVVINMAFQGIQADTSYGFDASEVSGMAADEFQQAFLDDSMFSAFKFMMQASNQAAVRQRDMIEYSLQATTSLPNGPAPKFVYTHLLLPHPPFIFDENGNLLPPQAADDWHYYLGQYKYTTKLAEQLVTTLLAKADPDNPPIIILQSDEGARNLQRRGPDNVVMNGYLENYPGQYNQYILNALYLPGFDYSQLRQDMLPVDTFQIILSHYLQVNLPITDYQGPRQ
jgi:hypothetical protein